jgi:hypothetical protein
MKKLYSMICAGALALGSGACDKGHTINPYLSCYDAHSKSDDGQLAECAWKIREEACRGEQDTPHNLFDGNTGKPLTELQICLDEQRGLEVKAAYIYYERTSNDATSR